MRTRKLPRKRDANAGFTLLELAIVLAVIGILSAILIPSFTGIVQRAEETAARQNCRIFAQSYALYLAEDEGGLSFDGYIFVSGDFAYCVESGELVGSDYEAEDGALIGSDGEPVVGSDDELGIAKVDPLPVSLRQDSVSVYYSACDAAYAKCYRVMLAAKAEGIAIPGSSYFISDGIAFLYSGQSLPQTPYYEEDKVTLGYVLYEFPEGFETEGVKLYIPPNSAYFG